VNRLALVVLLYASTAAMASASAATFFYLVLNTNTHQCQIMITKPDGEIMKMLGDSPYKSYDNAQQAMLELSECKPKSFPRF
jgi:hypothetical protein